VLLGVVHDLENEAALARQTNALLAKGFLKGTGGLGGVEALTGRDAMGWRSNHKAIVPYGCRKRAGLKKAQPQHSEARRLRVAGQEPNNVIVHNVDKKNQKEDQADLNEAFLKREAEVSAANAFQGQQQDVAAIENRNRKKIQDSEIDADQGHERNDSESAL